MSKPNAKKKDMISYKVNSNNSDWVQVFLQNPDDCYCIYQLIENEQNAYRLFMNLDYLHIHKMVPIYDSYRAVYSGPFSGSEPLKEKLENIFILFNSVYPEGFNGRSLSVSDIIAVKKHGVISFYYVDSVGFKKIPDFCPKDISDKYPVK